MKSPASRITVDIDSHVPNQRLRLLRATNGLRNAGAYDVEVATSTSGTGFHVTGFFDTPIPKETQFRIRENLNDDPNRIKMDRQRAERGLPINTMWTKKAGNEGERQVFDTVDDAIEYADANARDTQERMNAIQNHGHKALRDHEIPRMSLVTGK